MKKLVVFMFSVVLLGSCNKDIEGCTDPLAVNYNTDATIDDGSCTYPITIIPDTAFEQFLIIMGYDDVVDGGVLTSNINNIDSLYIFGNSNISDLTGIEDFSSLTHLNCQENQLINLDLSNNTALTYLNCSFNQLTSLDVSQSTSLAYLFCADNLLTSLNVNSNSSLILLASGLNQLTSLDVSQNTSLNTLYCSDNQLSCLNLKNGNNQNLSYITANGNSSLNCIEVDDSSWSNQYWTGPSYEFDTGTTFSTNCNYPAGCF